MLRAALLIGEEIGFQFRAVSLRIVFLSVQVDQKLGVTFQKIRLAFVNLLALPYKCDRIKENDRGYTVFEGHGSKEKMNMIFVVLPRKETPRVLKEIRKSCDNKVFVAVSEVSKYAGGYGMVK